jgi:hypothetical protein
MTRKIERELRKEFSFAEISITNHGHYRLRLPNGRIVIAASTPSCWRDMRNLRGEVRRQMNGPEPGSAP